MGRSDEFMFWEERLPVSCGGCEDESFESQHGASSPTLWRRGRIELRPETSTLLPQNHQYSCLSPTSRLRAILDGRKELMEMIKDMPESSHELTLKDIVNKQDIQESEEEEQQQQETEKHKRENRIPRSNNTKQICRSESMESQVFLLKMFLPISLTSKKKKKKKKKKKTTKKAANLEGPEIQANKQWWKIILVAIRLRDNHKNTNLITNPTSEKKCKSRGQGGCLF